MQTEGQDFAQSHSASGGGWGWILAYGIAVLLIGVLALANPIATGFATGVLIAFVLIAYGVFAIATSFSSLKGRARWIELLLGLLALAAGLATLFLPVVGALWLVWSIGAWLLVSGVLEVVSAVRFRTDRGWRLFLGVVDVLIGLWLLMAGPVTGLAFLAVLVGLSFLLRGVFLILLALALRRFVRA